MSCSRFLLKSREMAAALLLAANALAAGSGPGPEASKLSPDRPDLGRLTLLEAQRLAFERNWDLLAAKSDVDIATAQRIVAREAPNPTVSFSVLKVSVDDH